MEKRKKIIISVIAVVCALLIGLCSFLGIRACLDEQWRFTIQDTLSDGQGKQAKVILLGGQSNASGCSLDEYLKQNVSSQKYAEYENGYDNVYINYLSGLQQSNAFVKCKTRQGEMDCYFGPELGLAEKLHQWYPNETFFIIKGAWGNTNLYQQWLSPSSKGKTGERYSQFVAFVKASLQYLLSKNYDVTIEGMCWMQGESDCFFVETATGYETNLNNFIKDIRKTFSRYAGADGIAFIDAYIADNPMHWVYCDMVNASKQNVANASNLNVLIDTIAEGLRCDEEPLPTPDIPHYDSLSQLKLGYLFAENIATFFA